MMAHLDQTAMVLLDGFLYDPLDGTMFKYTRMEEIDNRDFEKEIYGQATQSESS